MNTIRFPSVSSCLLMAALATPSSLLAQETVEITGRDQRIDANFEEVYSVGVLEGESWEMFAQVTQVAFDAEGNLFVFDELGSREVRILVFDSTGDFLREFGRSGEGPGEFDYPVGFAVLRDGTTVVRDLGHRAYQLFDASGQYLRMVRTSDAPGGVASSRAIQGDPRGGAVFAGGFGAIIGLHGGDGGAPAALPTSRPVTWVGLQGEVVETETVADGWLPPRGEPVRGMAEDIMIGGGSLADALQQIAYPARFEPALLVGVLPDGGIVYSDSSTYALKITPPGSRTVTRIIRRPFEPEPVTPAIERDYQERLAARVGATGASGGSVRFVIETPSYHEIPVLHGLSTTWEGRIWVQRRGEHPESGGPIDVVTANGEYVGTYSTEATAMPDAFGPDGLAAFIELDEFDVASVVVRRVPTEVR
ncbi:MAG: 6-bladed beta-propeller [Gemmatimonadetes bacterium]|nr:6-bladed beta-propeller [Gemmatimonadota bacterium]